MTLKIEKKQPVGLTVVDDMKTGEHKEMEETVGDPVILDKPMANVGVKVGKTMNLGNYESVRVDVSLYVPCENEDEAINQTFDLVSNWCDLKMLGIMEEYEDSK